MQEIKKIAGRLQVTSKGFGFVTPFDEENKNDVFISRRDMADAMNGDVVVVELLPQNFGGQSPEGKIVKIERRKYTKVVGTFIKVGDYAFVEPDDKHLEDIFVAKHNFNGAKNKDKVYVEILVYPDACNQKKAEGKVLEILGKIGDVGIEILSIIKQKDLPLNFPKEVLQAAKKVPEKINSNEIQNRLDRRNRMVVTIDGEDAKDFDDAIYVEKVRGKNEWDLGVYIADVSYYVKENEILDKEAQERGNSVYLVDRVLPMLPERLCNGICSLNENVDRLVMACEMRFNDRGELLKYKIAPAVIRSKHRLTYNIVRKILAGDKKLKEKYADCVPMLKVADSLRKKLHAMRVQRGAINFEIPEVKVILDNNLHPVEIKQRVQGDAENLIEEFMLAANECVAKHLTAAHYPAVYRVHAAPKKEKLRELTKLLAMFKVLLEYENEVKPLDVQRALNKMKEMPEEKFISAVALRSMQQAVYQTENIGHFGLAAPCYVHFTSPIRRYPDLLIHRLLRLQFVKKKLKTTEFLALKENLQNLAEHASQRERLAVDAERATTNLKLCEYMQDHIGEEYDGTISGVTNFGIFVELPNGVEGMIRLQNLTDDYYEFRGDEYAVVGIRKHKRFRLGDNLRIKVLSVNMEEITIDFELIEEKNGKGHQNNFRKQKSTARLQSSGKVGVRHRTSGNGSKKFASGKGKSERRLRTNHKKR